MASWPMQLPRILLDGHSLQLNDPNLRTQMDSGAFRMRRKFLQVPEMHQVRMQMSDLQLQLFKYFYWEITEAGTEYFQYPLKDDQGTADQNMRIVVPPQYSPITDGKWFVAMTLELEQQRLITKAQYDQIINPHLLPDFDPNDFASGDFKTT